MQPISWLTAMSAKCFVRRKITWENRVFSRGDPFQGGRLASALTTAAPYLWLSFPRFSTVALIPSSDRAVRAGQSTPVRDAIPECSALRADGESDGSCLHPT